MTIKGKEKAMLACMAVLVIFMSSILLRLGTRMVLVKKLHMDNVITKMVLFDHPELQLKNKTDAMRIDMHWQEKYPFVEGEKTDAILKLKGKATALENKIKNVEDDKIGKWASNNFIFYRNIVEVGMKWNNLVGWHIMDPAKKVHKLEDGYLTFAGHRDVDSQERIASIIRLARFVENHGGKFLYVQTPDKSNKYADRELDGVDYRNTNTDMLLQGLADNGVATYDMRPELRQAVGDEGWHRAFFRTDHHWRPRTALWGAGKLAEKLHSDYQVDVNLSHLSDNDYRIEHYDKCFLGSQGKKITLVNTEPDDFDVYYPDFFTNIRWQIPSIGLDKTGDLTVMYDDFCLDLHRNMYETNPYAAYGYGDKDMILLHNYGNENLRDKKVLLLRDSFWDAGLFFLATALKDIVAIDVRHFDGSVESYVQQTKPDIVILSSTLIGDNKIKWTTHKDKFDFR